MMTLNTAKKELANHIDIVFSKSHNEVYINGESIISYNESGLPIGEFGLEIVNPISYPHEPAEVYFDNLVIYQYDTR